MLTRFDRNGVFGGGSFDWEACPEVDRAGQARHLAIPEKSGGLKYLTGYA